MHQRSLGYLLQLERRGAHDRVEVADEGVGHIGVGGRHSCRLAQRVCGADDQVFDVLRGIAETGERELAAGVDEAGVADALQGQRLPGALSSPADWPRVS